MYIFIYHITTDIRRYVQPFCNTCLASRPCPYSDDRRCKTSQACIRADRWCNQQIDCMDESDEEDCCKLEYCTFYSYIMYLL